MPYPTVEVSGFPAYQHQIRGILLYTVYLRSCMSKTSTILHIFTKVAKDGTVDGKSKLW
jgi:hypothetical protein